MGWGTRRSLLVPLAYVVLGQLWSGHARGNSNGDEEAAPFARGRTSAMVVVGTSSYANDDYIVAGGGIGYFVWPGLEVAFDVVHWFGKGDTDITKVSPSARYVLYQVPVVKPYGGVFYRHWFAHSDQLDDADTVGARIGALVKRGHLLIGVGALYETVLSDCSANCDVWAPEISLRILF